MNCTNVFLDYQNQWPFLKTMLKTAYVPSFNIQKYSRGDHFASLHSERTTLNTLHRLFAWMTYLNDVNDGGQTNFSHYGIKIKPENWQNTNLASRMDACAHWRNFKKWNKIYYYRLDTFSNPRF